MIDYWPVYEYGSIEKEGIKVKKKKKKKKLLDMGMDLGEIVNNGKFVK